MKSLYVRKYHLTFIYNYLGRKSIMICYFKKSLFLGTRLIHNYCSKMNIVPIKALEDNYMYLIIDKSTNEAAG
jgi:hypothetical protein